MQKKILKIIFRTNEIWNRLKKQEKVMKYINLVNIRVNDKNLEFEFLYKSKNNDNNEIYFKDQNMKEYFGQITKPENKITYSYNDET